jgi:hypothetical protein
MVQKTAAFRRRRADHTARWRERLRRGACVLPVEADATTFDRMERFGGLKDSKTGIGAVATALGRLLRRALEALLREEAASRRYLGALLKNAALAVCPLLGRTGQAGMAGMTRLTRTRHGHHSPEQQCSEEFTMKTVTLGDHFLFRFRCSGLLGRTGTLLIRVRSVREAPVKYPFLR